MLCLLALPLAGLELNGATLGVSNLSEPEGTLVGVQAELYQAGRVHGRASGLNFSEVFERTPFLRG